MKLDILYKDKKKEIYDYYKELGLITVDSIQEVNDNIIDKKIKKEDLENDLMEFYITVSMCSFMIENDLYDEYFFTTYAELLNEYKNGTYDNMFMDILADKADLESDIEEINEYIKKDEAIRKYYDDVSDIYNEDLEQIEKLIEDNE